VLTDGSNVHGPDTTIAKGEGRVGDYANANVHAVRLRKDPRKVLQNLAQKQKEKVEKTTAQWEGSPPPHRERGPGT